MTSESLVSIVNISFCERLHFQICLIIGRDLVHDILRWFLGCGVWCGWGVWVGAGGGGLGWDVCVRVCVCVLIATKSLFSHVATRNIRVVKGSNYNTTRWSSSWKSMMTSSNGNIFRATGPSCGEFTGEFPTQRPVMRSFDVFFDLRLNKRLSKQPWAWWFETPSWSLWRHCNANLIAASEECTFSNHDLTLINRLHNNYIDFSNIAYPIHLRNQINTNQDPLVTNLRCYLYANCHYVFNWPISV